MSHAHIYRLPFTKRCRVNDINNNRKKKKKKNANKFHFQLNYIHEHFYLLFYLFQFQRYMCIASSYIVAYRMPLFISRGTHSVTIPWSHYMHFTLCSICLCCFRQSLNKINDGKNKSTAAAAYDVNADNKQQIHPITSNTINDIYAKFGNLRKLKSSYK